MMDRQRLGFRVSVYSAKITKKETTLSPFTCRAIRGGNDQDSFNKLLKIIRKVGISFISPKVPIRPP